MSPLLIFLVMEALGRMLDKFVHEGCMSGFRMGDLEGRSLGCLIFSLPMTLKFFVTLTLVLILYTVLNWFEAVYGLKINLGKSELAPDWFITLSFIHECPGL